MNWLEWLFGTPPAHHPAPGETEATPLYVRKVVSEAEQWHETRQDGDIAKTNARLDILAAQLKNITRQGD